MEKQEKQEKQELFGQEEFRPNVESVVHTIDEFEQGGFEWKKMRLGKITSSMIYSIMGKPTKKAQEMGEIFSETAKSYLYNIASQRNLKNKYRDDESYFAEYLARVDVKTKAMQYGTDNEELARMAYQKFVADKEGNEVYEVGFVECLGELKGYGDSPDGLVRDKNGKTIGCLEIKCPTPETFVKYYEQFKSGKTLFEVEEKYYWQVLSHCLANNVEWCDFVYFDKMQNNSFQCVRVTPNVFGDDKTLCYLHEQIKTALTYIDNLSIFKK